MANTMAGDTDSEDGRNAGVLDSLVSFPQSPGEKTALIFGDNQISYKELHARVSYLAAGLAGRFDQGEILAIWLSNSPEILCLYLACLKAGVVPMPLHLGMKWPEVRAILEQSGVKQLITSGRIADPYKAEFSGTRLERIYDIDRKEAESPYLPGSDLSEEAPGDERHSPNPGSTGLILHTSGSNGSAKGVKISYASLGHILRYRLTHTGLTSESVSVVGSCLTQSVGIYQSLALLAAGATLVLLESYETERMVDCVNLHQPTHLIMVVEAFDHLLHHPRISESSFRRIVFACAGADRVTARIQDRFIALTGKPLRVSYGLTESSWVLVNSGDRMEKRLALGKPCPDIEVKLLGADGLEVSTGEIGELYIKSPRTMLGYLNDGEQTRDAFANGWLASGDLVYQDDDGYFWFSGRRKNMIVLSSGDNISPVEIENAILRHPSVASCTVAGVSESGQSEVIRAFVTRSDDTLSEEDLIMFLRSQISDYKVPGEIVFVNKLPVGLTGKILARASDEVNRSGSDGETT